MILKRCALALGLCIGLTLLGCADQRPTLVQLDAVPPPAGSTASPSLFVHPSATSSATPVPSPTVTPVSQASPTSKSARAPTDTPTNIPTSTPSATHTPSWPADPIPVTLRTPDGFSLAGALYLPKSNRPYPGVVLSHMGGASKEAWGVVPMILQESGYAVLSYDFRGHGQSDGHLDPSSARVDLQAAFAYLHSHPAVDAERIGLVGASMGGMASVIIAAADPTVRAVFAISTSPEAAGQDPGRVVGQLSPRPFLAVGCDRDPLTRPERVRQLFEAAGPPKRIHILACAAHANDILATETDPQLVELMLDWLDDYVKTGE